MTLALDDLLPRSPAISLKQVSGAGYIGRFLRTELSSVYQPIVEASSGLVVAHEAFVRVFGAGERNVAPWNLFALVANDDMLLALDRLCRVLHILNAEQASPGAPRLHLNVHGRLLAAVREDHGHTFRRALERLEIEPGRVVIEVPELANAEPKLVAFVLANYRLNGFLTAANCHGVPELQAVLRVVRPNLVKIDARQLSTPTQIAQAADLARQHGTQLVFMRIESEAQARSLAEFSGVLLQGNAIGMPLPSAATKPCATLSDRYRVPAAQALTAKRSALAGRRER